MRGTLGRGAYMTSFPHWVIRLRYLQLIFQDTVQASGKQRLPAGVLKICQGEGREGEEKAGLSGEVNCCPSLEKDGMMDGAWRQRSNDRGRSKLHRKEVAVTSDGT